MAFGSGNSSSPSFVARAEPYPNTRNGSKGIAPLNNKNPELSGYESATSKRVTRQQKKQKLFHLQKKLPPRKFLSTTPLLWRSIMKPLNLYTLQTLLRLSL